MDYTDLGPAMAEAAARIGNEKNANSIEELALRITNLEEFVTMQMKIIEELEDKLRRHIFPCE